MKRNEIISTLTDEIAKLTGVAENLNETDSLKDDLGLDSLDLVSLIVSLETEFNITIDDSDLNPDSLIDLKSLVLLVEKYI